MNPFARCDRLSGVDRTYRRYLRRWRDELWERHLLIMSEICERNMEVASCQRDEAAWWRLTQVQRAARDGELDRLYAAEERSRQALQQAFDKITLYCSAPFEHLGELDAGKKLNRADTAGVLVGAVVDARPVDGATSEVAAQERLEADTPKRLHAPSDEGGTHSCERVHKRARK